MKRVLVPALFLTLALALAVDDSLAAPAPAAATTPPEAPADATAPVPSETASTARMSPAELLVSKMTMRSGLITLSGGKVTVRTSKDFVYLDARDSRTLLVDVYGNPPDAADGVLGIILPANVDPLAADSWFAVLSHEDDGHVADDDAASIDYDELLKSMQDEINASNPEREKAGYERQTLVGWAQKPSYEQATHKLHWAKDIRFGGSTSDTLNYAIRVLGRTGVLQVNVVADMKQLKAINREVPGILRMVEFTEGNRYADFDSSADPVAAYGLAGLIAGGVAAKAGFFKGMLALLLASKKLLIGLVVGLGAAFWSGYRRLQGWFGKTS